MIVREQEPLSRHTTFDVGGPAALYLVPESVEEVKDAIRLSEERGVPFYIIGRGSNLLFDDEGYDGVIIEIGRGLEQIVVEGNQVRAQAGISMSAMGARLAEEELTGFEFASGIPGTVGGGITMNAGAYGGEIKDCICSARVLTPQGVVLELTKEELQLGYRTSVIPAEGYIVLEGTFFFERGKKEDILERMRELNRSRREKQPLEYPSAGSTFKRPEGYFAGKLIQDAGLRGCRVGDAQVSEKHCGFVVNRGNASAAEIRQLIKEVQDRVWERFQVKLEPEIRIVK